MTLKMPKDDKRFIEAAIAEYCQLHGVNEEKIALMNLKKMLVEEGREEWTQEERPLIPHLQQLNAIFRKCQEATPPLEERHKH